MKRGAGPLRRKEVVGRWVSDPCQSISIPRFFTFISPFLFLAFVVAFWSAHSNVFPFHFPPFFLVYCLSCLTIPSTSATRTTLTHITIFQSFFPRFFSRHRPFSLSFALPCARTASPNRQKMTNQDKQPDGGTCHYFCVWSKRFPFLRFPSFSFLIALYLCLGGFRVERIEGIG